MPVFLLKLQMMSKGKRFLVVDDEPDLREILTDEFRYAGGEVIEAANGAVALGIYKKEKPDAVVSDIRMPGGDGVTLAKAIKAIDPAESRVFLISGFADLIPADAYALGVEGFFTKPFQLEEVRDLVLQSFLANEVRWTREKPKETPEVLELAFSDWEKQFSAGAVSSGRGGIFVPGSQIRGGLQPYFWGQKVGLKSGDTYLGEFTVRWVRHEAGDGEVGVGLEYFRLEPQFLKFVLSRNDVLGRATYIPAGR